jgi:hypothetical protein
MYKYRLKGVIKYCKANTTVRYFLPGLASRSFSGDETFNLIFPAGDRYMFLSLGGFLWN